MGLDTTHNCWHGPYSSFNDFRHALANEIGVDLKEYRGYSDNGGSKDLRSINHGIMPLLDHSDCDGELTPEECKQIADGLDDILSKLTKEDDDLPYHFRENIKKFRDGCLLAYSRNEIVDFH